LTHLFNRNYSAISPNFVKTLMSREPINHLEQSIEQLIALSERLQKENTGLQRDKRDLLKERGKLLENNTQAQTQIEGMITRLKALNTEG